MFNNDNRSQRWISLSKEFNNIVGEIYCIDKIIETNYGRSSSQSRKLNTLRKHISILKSDFDSIVCEEYEDYLTLHDNTENKDINLTLLFYNSKKCDKNCYMQNNMNICNELLDELNTIIDNIVSFSDIVPLNKYLHMSSFNYIKKYKFKTQTT